MAASKTVLITGTSTGIGLAAAVGAARAGWDVVATMRDPGKAGRLLAEAGAVGAAGRIHVERLDVTDAASIASAVARATAAHDGLDAVVNNAGAGVVGTIEVGGMEPVRAAMEVNYFGVVEVTRATMPHLRASKGRLVTVTSVGGVVGQPFNEAYCAAKFAVEGFMEALASVAAAVGVRVSVVEPGAVASEFVASQRIDIPALVAEAGPYGPALQSYIDRALQSFGNAQSAEEAAATVVEVLEAEDPPFRVQTSEWARGFTASKLADVDGSAVQAMMAQWLETR
ncbi:short-chain dehydrogenase/reductase SDR [Catenulispora acidiphila DSM 44928]|uniref:Short-chain dehydrogenase/reductase SDR n=1 Tax=Catenulispora acidiphila (strain DSM 44928 / JCM 14897 / NBRC 102108 / NRRL B-24433 / ID139908) TaxID=479433 RepID=C7Q5C5_CATAD|nr:SDR family NAD(P)-dependent oxidoreductase [Catenulispora acidiphila]ACU75894.1 short-chain dehydrogenase/reductase SDR [Catenulispora acidiphila DSM 44928]